MILNPYESSYVGLILVFLMIFFGRSFRDNWKNKKYKWVFKSWVYGLISFISFVAILFIPWDFKV
jgi:membrane protein DedA with SNARE-associated domain